MPSIALQPVPEGERSSRQWLCLMVPQWPLVAAAEEADLDLSLPIVLVENSKVRALSPAAWAGGVRRGMKESTAHHLIPQLVPLPPARAVEQQKFTHVVQALFQVSAHIYQLRPGVALVPIGQGQQTSTVEDFMVQTLDAVVQTTGYEAHAGVAWNMASAILAAQSDSLISRSHSIDFLQAHPVSSLVHLSQGEPQQKYLQQLIIRLEDFGVKRLGEWAGWSSAHTGKQFGREGIFYHRIVQGYDWQLPVANLPISDLQWQLDYDPPLERYEQLIFQARALVEQAVEDLIFHSKTCDLITVRLEDTAGNQDTRTWVVPDLDLTAIQRSIRWHLEGWLGDSNQRTINHPLTKFVITAHEPQSAAVAQNQLWAHAGKEQQALRVAHRLEGMLGEGQVQVPRWQGSYHPKHKIKLQPWQKTFEAKRGSHKERIPAAQLPVASPSPQRTWVGEVPAPFPSKVGFLELNATVLDAQGEAIVVNDRGELTATPSWVKISTQRSQSSTQAVVGWRGPWVFFHQWWHGSPPQQLLYLLREDDSALLVGNYQFGSPHWQVEGIYE